jgi:hypothetical protein
MFVADREIDPKCSFPPEEESKARGSLDGEQGNGTAEVHARGIK